MHRSASLHHCQRRLKSPDRRHDSLPSDPHGLGLEYHQDSESHSDRHISTGHLVCRATPSTWRSMTMTMTDNLAAYASSQLCGLAKLLL